MTGYGFFRAMRVMLGGILALVVFVSTITLELRNIMVREAECKKAYGEHWQAEYELRYGPVADGRKKIWVGSGGVAAVGILSWLIYRQIAGKRQSGYSRRRRR